MINVFKNFVDVFFLTYCISALGGTAWLLGGGEAGEDGAVLEPEDVVLDEVFGVVVVEELPELTVELESDVGNPEICWLWFWRDTWTLATVLEWSVGIKGALSSVVGVGGATFDGPGWVLQKKQTKFGIQTIKTQCNKDKFHAKIRTWSSSSLQSAKYQTNWRTDVITWDKTTNNANPLCAQSKISITKQTKTNH